MGIGARDARRRESTGAGGSPTSSPIGAGLEAAAAGIRERLGFGGEDVEEPVPLEAIELPAPRVRPPASLEIVADDHHERVSHALGKAYRDVVRGFRGQIDNPPDLVARPRDEAEVEAVLEWCADDGVAAIPYGGGTSVVGGVEPRVGDGYARRGDDRPRSARPGARGRSGLARGADPGRRPRPVARGPARASTGSPCATSRSRSSSRRSAAGSRPAPAATSRRSTPTSTTWSSRCARSPRPAPGRPAAARLRRGPEPRPDADRLRGDPRGDHRGLGARAGAARGSRLSCGVAFESFAARRRGGARARAVGPQPGQLPPARRGRGGAHPRGRRRPGALLVLGFESAHQPVDALMDQALELRAATTAARSRRETPRRRTPNDRERRRGDAVGAWRHAFLAAPYLRDTFVACGVLSDTFETAITWDRFEGFHASVMETARRRSPRPAERPDGPRSPRLSCRFTHVYPGRPGALLHGPAPRPGAAARSSSGTRSRRRSRRP